MLGETTMSFLFKQSKTQKSTRVHADSEISLLEPMYMKNLSCLILFFFALIVSPESLLAKDSSVYLDQVAVWTDTDNPETRVLSDELNRQVSAYLELSGDDTLMPPVIQRGIGGYLALFGNPAEVAGTLADIAPLLEKPLQEKAIAKAKSLIKKHPPWEETWVVKGADGSWQKRPPDRIPINFEKLDIPTGNLYFLWQVCAASNDYTFADENWDKISSFIKDNYVKNKDRKKKVKIVTRWLSKKEQHEEQLEAYGRFCIGGIVPGSFELKTQVKIDGKKTNISFKDDGKGNFEGDQVESGSIDYEKGDYKIKFTGDLQSSWIRGSCKADAALLFGDIAGLVGYARMAEKLKKPDSKQARSLALEALNEAKAHGYNGMYQRAARTFITHHHDGAYCPFHIIRDGSSEQQALSLLWSHEVGRMLKDEQQKEIIGHLEEYLNKATQLAWFQNHGLPGPDTANDDAILLPGGDGIGGENSNVGPAVGFTFYMLRAYVTDAPKEKLMMWTDVPWARVGDNLHMQRLAACIRAYGKQSFEKFE